MQEMRVQTLSWEDPLEKEMATHSNILAWRIIMDRGAWWAAVQGVLKEWLNTHTHTHTLDFRHHWCRNGACSCLRSWDPLLPSGPLSPSSPDTDTTHPGPSSVHRHHACMRADSLLGPALRWWSPSSPTPTPAPLEQGGSRQWRAGGFPPTLASATPPPCTDTHLESCLCTGSQFLTSLIH